MSIDPVENTAALASIRWPAPRRAYILVALANSVHPLPRQVRVLVLCPYPHGGAPCQRFRYEQYLDALGERGVSIDEEPFLDESAMRLLYKTGYFLVKATAVLKGFAHRLAMLSRARRYDFVFIHRETTPIGPPVIEWALFQLGCKVVYDFDDAIFITPKSATNPLMAYVRCAWKVPYITKRSHAVSVCNSYLVDWSKRLNERVTLIPTTIDETYHRPRPHRLPGPRTVIGWTGSHSTARYLDIIRPVLLDLQERFDFEFRVICDRDPGFPELKHYRFVAWTLATEIDDLWGFDIGVMPVAAEDWANGKVGFKAIQYAALGIPTVASAFGSGGEVVHDGETGLLVQNDVGSWTLALERMLRDPARTTRMGHNARDFILKSYSVSANVSKYLGLFEER